VIMSCIINVVFACVQYTSILSYGKLKKNWIENKHTACEIENSLLNHVGIQWYVHRKEGQT
jgi:hypothetical protein